MNRPDQSLLLQNITDTLTGESRIVFAYLYGSVASEGSCQDIDIAVYSADEDNPHVVGSDLKIALHKKTGLPPDTFDIRVLNGLPEHGDIFGLLYLKNVLTCNRLLVDKDSVTRTDFIERYGRKFRECEGLIEEVLA